MSHDTDSLWVQEIRIEDYLLYYKRLMKENLWMAQNKYALALRY